jgi:hypothetical protein
VCPPNFAVVFSALIFRVSSEANPAGFLIWCVLGFALGIVLFFWGFRLLQRRRLILDTPLSKIRSASMGMVEISGQAVGPYTMTAPVSGRSCYYYRTQVWEWKQNGKNKQWVQAAAECMHVPFFVDDNTGRLMVDPRGAELDLHCDFKEEFNGSLFTHDDPPASVNRFLSCHGVGTINKIRVEEYCIKPKNSLFILGTMTDNPGLEVTPNPIQDALPPASFSSHGLSVALNLLPGRNLLSSEDDDFAASPAFAPTPSRAHAREIIQLTPESGPTKSTEMTQQQKVATALMRAGIANPAAWAAAGILDSKQGVQVATDPSFNAANSKPSNGNPQNTMSGNGFDARPPVVLMRGESNPTFLISWRSQREVARSLGWKCTLMIWGGSALALACLYFFLWLKSVL